MDQTQVEMTATGMNAGVMMVFGLIYLVIIVLMIASVWKVFTKAGKPGWAALIPFYNIYMMITIAGRPGWWMLLFFIPFVNFIIGIIINLDLARNFGKSALFGIASILFPFVTWPILAFGDATYNPRPA